ncbi:hypothetical protein PG996_003888 [Apiospora saccharicola]|uniref:Alpha/beta hydrolase fold-3 domain-containing protein n=1 Tax=Apiospora saccharicola TaxID=335842 RepID=A0ABR1W6E7_9PEZI
MTGQAYLDPLNQGFVELAATMPGLDQLSPEEVRESMEKLNEHEQLPGVGRNMITTPTARGTETWIYTPTGAKGPFPYIVYVHGGGFMSGRQVKHHAPTLPLRSSPYHGSLHTLDKYVVLTKHCRMFSMSVYDSIVTDLVLRTGYAVVFPEYTLAPEAKWPAQQDQCFEVLEWMAHNGACHNLIPDKFALIGDSAGGLLIFNMNVVAQQKGLTVPYNVFISPMATLDYFHKQPTPSGYAFWDGYYLTMAAMRRFVSEYAPEGTMDRTSELASPSTNMSDAVAARFAPSLIVTSAVDVLRDEAEALGERLQRAGRDVTVFRAHGQVHDSVALNALRGGPTPKMAMTLIAAALKQRLG